MTGGSGVAAEPHTGAGNGEQADAEQAEGQMGRLGNGRDGEIVDGQTCIITGVVRISPSKPEFAIVGDVKPCDGERDIRVISAVVSVQ